MNFDSYIANGTKRAITLESKVNLHKKAFTLAETLITLTIIGVLAAMTIPTLISKYQKHTYVVGLKKAYSALQNAMKMIPISQGCPAGDYECAKMFSEELNIDGKTLTSKWATYMYVLSKQFKVAKLCMNSDQESNGYENIWKCLGTKPYKDIVMDDGFPAGFVTEDGMIFMTSSGLYINNEDGTSADNVGPLIVDVNGTKGPNKWGRDLFPFIITEQNIKNTPAGTVIPYGSKLHDDLDSYSQYWKDGNKCTAETITQNPWDGWSCTGRVLEEDAMNY